ncbi:MAG: hypothetical protein GYA22_03880 [Bacteroidales bacterium]|nr:hypothetical protein [Bacteroidales bacterium]
MKNHRFPTLFHMVVWLLLLISVSMVAQNVDRAYRLIEKDEFDKAEEILTRAYGSDSSKSNVNLGLGLVYSADSYPRHNYFKAWQHMLVAGKTMDAATTDEKESMKQLLFNIETLKNNWPLKQKFEYRQKDIENKLIKYVREEKDLDMVNEFIARFPDSKFYENVVHIRNYLEFGKAIQENTIESYNRFITKLPDAAQIPEAVELRNKLAFDLARKVNTIQAYNDFIKNYPDAVQVIEATHLRDELAFEEAKKQNTIEAFESFINQYPHSLQVTAATRLYQHLIFEKAKKINTFEAYTEFIKKFPEGEQFIDVYNLRSAALGQKYLSSNPHLTNVIWIRGFDQSGALDNPSGLTVTPDGKITFGGSTAAKEGSSPEAWVISLDQEGKLLWNKTFPVGKGSHISALSNTTAGDYIMAGYTQKELPEGEIKGWLIKINPQGFKYWDKEYEANEFKTIRMNKSGEILASGYYYDSLSLPCQFIGVYKESGKIFWERKYTGRGILKNLEPGAMNEVYAAGNHWCFKTDPNGYIIWEYYTSPADSILAMTTAKTGEPILLCAGPDHQLKIIYLDKSGKKSSEKVYMSIPNLIVRDMVLRPTGDILAFGSEDRNAVIINLSKSGALQKVLSFAAGSPSSVQSLVMLPDNTAIVLIATGTESTGTDAVVLKMSPDI